jgi:YfiH family protein
MMAVASPQDPDPDWIVPAWPVPAGVRALITTRRGGVSQGPWGAPDGGGMNLGEGSDAPEAVAHNRQRLRARLPAEPCWLEQVHGNEVIDASAAQQRPRADAAYTVRAGVVCCVLAADCLPVLLADAAGRGVAAAHAGWRGLAAGVIQRTVDALRQALGEPSAELLAYLGPAIGPQHFQVGGEVLAALRVGLPMADAACAADGPGKYRADLFALARQALAQRGVVRVHGGGLCTYSDPARFYSYRRATPTGRQAALIWRKSPG